MYYKLNEDLWFWWYDESVRQFLLWYYWPNFLMGNFDDWASLGLTLNGVRPNVSAQNMFDFFNLNNYNICKI